MRDENLNTVSIASGAGNRHLYYRPGSSDEGVIRQILTNREYDLARLRRNDEIGKFSWSILRLKNSTSTQRKSRPTK